MDAMTFASINGAILPVEKALVPISDRGLRFGDGVFETIAVHAGIPYQWKLHQKRLQSGLSALSIAFDTSKLLTDCLALIKKNKLTEGFVRVMVTRGSGSEGYLPAPSAEPRCIIGTMPRKDVPHYADLLVCSYTKPPLSSLPCNNKLMQGVNSTLARLEAKSAGCLDALQLDSKGNISECSSANIFWVKNNTLYTPSLATACLDGTTRATVLRLGTLKVKQGAFKPAALKAADCAFITNTNWQILPVRRIVPWNVSFNEKSAALKQLQTAYAKDIKDYVAEHKA